MADIGTMQEPLQVKMLRVLQEQEIERVEIRQFKALDGAGDQRAKVRADARGRQLAHQQRIPLRPQRDHATIGGIALVA